MKRIMIALVIMLMMPMAVFATNIDLKADKTQLSTDDVVHVNLTIDGQIDGGQIGIKGLENFDIVAQQSSQSIQIINGNTTQVQSKQITIQPKSAGTFTIKALAQENGQQIQSDTVTLNVQKSEIDATKDKLLQNTQQTTPQVSPQPDNTTSALDDAIGKQEPKSDFDTNLLKESQTQPAQSEDTNTTATPNNPQDLQVNKIENFPKVEHISPFNTMFWLQSLGIILIIASIIAIVFYMLHKKKK